MRSWNYKMIVRFLLVTLYPIALVVTSCQQTSTADFHETNREYLPPNRFEASLITDSLVEATGTPLLLDTELVPISPNVQNPTNAHPNHHIIPSQLKKVKIEDDKIFMLPFQASSNKQNPNYQINPKGDTVLMGKKFEMQQGVIEIEPQEFTEAASPRYRDQSTSNIQFLDVEHGMISPYVFSLLEDQRGDIWMGNGLGISKYDGVNFTHFTYKKGFATAWSVLEDRNGNIWFGTIGNGIIKYDGLNYTEYYNQTVANEVYSIEEGRDGKLWFGTSEGLVQYDGTDFLRFGREEGFLDIQVNAIFEDSQETLWLGTNQGAVMFDGHRFRQFSLESGLSDDIVLSIFEDAHGNLWFGTERGGVNRFDGESFVHYTVKEGLSENAVRVILEDDAGHLWFITDGGGANQFTGDRFIHYSLREGLYVDVYASIIDSGGNFWFGTNGGGVSKFSPHSFIHYSESEGLVNSYVYAIEEDKQGNLWIGTDHGLNKYDGQNFLEYLSHDVEISAICEDRSGNLWLGTIVHGFYQFDGISFKQYEKVSGRDNLQITSIDEDRFGNVWLSTKGDGAIRFDGERFMQFTTEDGLSDNVVNVIKEDSKGNLWFGTDGGLSKLEGNRFSSFKPASGFLTRNVNSIAEDSLGNLWLGSKGHGVCMYDGHAFTNFTEKQGLSYDLTWATAVDHRGHIWVTTEKGLNQIIPIVGGHLVQDQVNKGVQYKIIPYKTGDGLKGNDFFSRSLCLDSKNQLWLGNGKCLSVVDLNNHSASSNIPKVSVTRLDINGELIDYKASELNADNGIVYEGTQTFRNLPFNLQLPYHKNHITLHFSAIDWKAPHDLEYSYVLEGLNERWSPVTRETKIDYRNVPYGEFTFRLRSRGKSQEWSEEDSIGFVISPPWYHTAWARGIFILLGFALVGTLFLIRERNARIVRKRLERMVDEKTFELQEEKQEVSRQLVQKEILMQEVHHRVKNNLTFLKSLLYLRANATHDQEVKVILEECQARIHSMALVHQNLYDVDDSSEVDFNIFLKELFVELEGMFEQDLSEIQIDLDVGTAKIDMKLSVFLGLILNEMITNSFKYAFNGHPAKSIGVALSDMGSTYRLRYSDSGKGFPVGFDFRNAKGFGFKMINILLDQIDAEMTHTQDELNTFTILIPK